MQENGLRSNFSYTRKNQRIFFNSILDIKDSFIATIISITAGGLHFHVGWSTYLWATKIVKYCLTMLWSNLDKGKVALIQVAIETNIQILLPCNNSML